MTVAELIEALSILPRDMRVFREGRGLREVIRIDEMIIGIDRRTGHIHPACTPGTECSLCNQEKVVAI